MHNDESHGPALVGRHVHESPLFNDAGEPDAATGFDYGAIDGPQVEPAEPDATAAGLARKILQTVLAGPHPEACRRRAVLVAFLLAPSLVYPVRTKAGLARLLGVSRAAITQQLFEIERELIGSASK